MHTKIERHDTKSADRCASHLALALSLAVNEDVLLGSPFGSICGRLHDPLRNVFDSHDLRRQRLVLLRGDERKTRVARGGVSGA